MWVYGFYGSNDDVVLPVYGTVYSKVTMRLIFNASSQLGPPDTSLTGQRAHTQHANTHIWHHVHSSYLLHCCAVACRLLVDGNSGRFCGEGDSVSGWGCAGSIALDVVGCQFVWLVLLIYAPLKMRYYRAYFADAIRAHSISLWEQIYASSSSNWLPFVIYLKYIAASSFINRTWK